MKNALRNTLVGFGGGGIIGAAIWGAIELFDISPLLAWIIAGAAVGGFGAISWMMVNRPSRDQQRPGESDREPPR